MRDDDAATEAGIDGAARDAAPAQDAALLDAAANDGGPAGDGAQPRDGSCDSGCAFLSPTSCKELLAECPCSPSGIYELGATTTYQAYCEMVADGGGWTLVMKLDGNDPTFEYDAALWTSRRAFSPGQPDFDLNQAKLGSYWTVSFTELRLGMIEGGTTRWLIAPLSADSLHAAVAPGLPIATGLRRRDWYTLVASGSLQTGCDLEGVNAAIAGGARVRIGMAADEASCGGYGDSYLGFGGISDTCGGDGNITTGNVAGCGGDDGDRNTATFGYVMVR